MDNQTEGNDEAATQPSDDREDYFFRTLADLANGGLPGMAVTLTCDGMLISGQLTSSVAFFEYIREAWERIVPTRPADDEQPGKKNALVVLAEQAIEASRERNEEFFSEGTTEFLLTTFVHLRDVRYFVPGSPPFKTDFWRGRIDRISGFNIGQMVEAD
ncbi:hypothetical protein LJR234_000369 [Mesorhizobium amorphae]|uniref:hypothetical protein n=1 Tax=Mesorhizobium amorphae TaxID=71433 RepID=UPI003ECDB2F8